ncbi:hypothetical protein [Streptomyces sp. NPDC127038]|uniref:hypothetical protein n=1 Tax=Streptomyces sp. NPDC127038 TaxID=3347114 RepID=UPI0036673676
MSRSLWSRGTRSDTNSRCRLTFESDDHTQRPRQMFRAEAIYNLPGQVVSEVLAALTLEAALLELLESLFVRPEQAINLLLREGSCGDFD